MVFLMVWLSIVIVAYLFGAIANVLDKYLLGSKRISSAPVYAFYVGIFGLFAFMFAPFGLVVPSTDIMVLCLISGAMFLLGIMLLYFAIGRAQASRVVPVFGAVIPLVSFVLAASFGVERLTAPQVFGAALLVVGGLLISFDLPLRLGKKKFFSGFFHACGAGVLVAFAYLIFKDISGQENFVTWYIWTRVGIFIGALLLLADPVWRRKIFRSFFAAKNNGRHVAATGGIFVTNKIVGGLSTILVSYAISLGSVTLVNALVSLQYAFVLIIAVAIGSKLPHIFEERLYFWDWAQKIAAILIIAVGVYFIS
jgi:drug/metabolite transporter (DMT)-like permease